MIFSVLEKYQNKNVAATTRPEDKQADLLQPWRDPVALHAATSEQSRAELELRTHMPYYMVALRCNSHWKD